MQKYVKIYMQALEYDISDYIPSELSARKAVDIHHIVSRGKGGEDRIENLMALTRGEHVEYGDKKEWMYFLLIRHYDFLKRKGVAFSKEWFDKMFNKYEDQHAY